MWLCCVWWWYGWCWVVGLCRFGLILMVGILLGVIGWICVLGWFCIWVCFRWCWWLILGLCVGWLVFMICCGWNMRNFLGCVWCGWFVWCFCVILLLVVVGCGWWNWYLGGYGYYWFLGLVFLGLVCVGCVCRFWLWWIGCVGIFVGCLGWSVCNWLGCWFCVWCWWLVGWLMLFFLIGVVFFGCYWGVGRFGVIWYGVVVVCVCSFFVFWCGGIGWGNVFGWLDYGGIDGWWLCFCLVVGCYFSDYVGEFVLVYWVVVVCVGVVVVVICCFCYWLVGFVWLDWLGLFVCYWWIVVGFCVGV